MRAPSGGSRWGLTSAPTGAPDAGAAQAQVRMKNRVIADLRSQKQQLTGVPPRAWLHATVSEWTLNLLATIRVWVLHIILSQSGHLQAALYGEFLIWRQHHEPAGRTCSSSALQCRASPSVPTKPQPSQARGKGQQQLPFLLTAGLTCRGAGGRAAGEPAAEAAGAAGRAPEGAARWSAGAPARGTCGARSGTVTAAAG